jgi:hypothetical protein
MGQDPEVAKAFACNSRRNSCRHWVLCFLGILYRAKSSRRSPRKIQIDGWPKRVGLKIAVLSDIHAGSAFIDEKKLRLIVNERMNSNLTSS